MTAKKKLSAVQARLKAATGETSPFHPKNKKLLARMARERQRRDAVLHLQSIRQDILILARNTSPDPKRPGLRDGFFVYDYDDKRGQRRLELGIRRQTLGVLAQSQTELSRDEVATLVRYLQAFLEGGPRAEQLPLTVQDLVRRKL